MKGRRICLGKKKLTIKQNKTKKMAYKKGPATFMKGQTKNKAVGYMAQGSAFHLDPDPEKKAEQLTKKQKFQAAGAALGEDVSFTLKTFEDDGQSFDPRSGRVISEIKSKLKKQKPEIYKDLYGE